MLTHRDLLQSIITVVIQSYPDVSSFTVHLSPSVYTATNYLPENQVSCKANY